MNDTFALAATFRPAAPAPQDHDDVVARISLIKPNGSGDTGMAEER
ncbi:hypothetical protein [Cellulomonas sp. P5_C5]